MNQVYRVTKKLTITLSITIALLYILISNGTLTEYISPLTAFLGFAINFWLLVISLVAFLWSRNHQHTPKRDIKQGYERYAAEQADALPAEAESPTSLTVSDAVFAQLGALYEAVDVTLDQPINRVTTGETIRLLKQSQPTHVAIAEVIAIHERTLRVRPIHFPE